MGGGTCRAWEAAAGEGVAAAPLRRASRLLLFGVAGLAWLSPASGFGGPGPTVHGVQPRPRAEPAAVGVGRGARAGLARVRVAAKTLRVRRRQQMSSDLASEEREGAKGPNLYEDNAMYDREWVTPLWMITQEPDLNDLVKYLQEKRIVITDNPDQEHVLYFSRAQIEAAREAFSRMVRRGEMRLHRLSELTGSEIFETRYSRQVVVVGQRNGQGNASGQGQRFQLVQPLSAGELYAQTDLDLGSRQLERFMWQDKSQSWNKASLVANFVEYDALEVNEWGVFKCISRIKAEEEIWNKVVDEIFEIDNLVKREKELRHLSRFVKDVFGLKIVVGDEEQARRCQKKLENLKFSNQALLSHGVPVMGSTKVLTFVEVKDYLSQNPGETEIKSSGWRALKSVVQWWDTTIEIQIQVLRNYHRERERITKESHSEFKARREQLREIIATSKPLFRFYRDLLQWLFQTTASPESLAPPTFNNVRVELLE